MTDTFGPGASRAAQTGMMMAELDALLREADQSFRAAAQEIEGLAAAMPAPDAEFTGRDEDRNVEVVLSGRLRVTDLVIDGDPESGTEVTQWIEEAVRNALERAFDPEAVAEREEGHRDILAGARPRSLEMDTVDGFPAPHVYAEIEEQEAALAALERSVEAHPDTALSGSDESGRVTVALSPDGMFQSVRYDERWLESVRSNAIASHTMEAFRAAYAQIDERLAESTEEH